MKVLAPKATVDKELFPKLFAGEYGAEISTLLTSKSQVAPYELLRWRSRSASSTRTRRARLRQAHAVHRDDGRSLDLAACATSCPTAPSSAAAVRTVRSAPDSELNRWFQKIYTDRYSMPPTYPAYQMAQSLLGLKTGLGKGAGEEGRRASRRPTRWSPRSRASSSKRRARRSQIAIGNGHQGISETAYGTYQFNKAEERAGDRRHHALSGRMRESAGGVNADDWIKAA